MQKLQAMSMVFRFRMLSDENDNFVRDYEVPYDMTLLDFHNFILRSLEYEECMASFFTADERWEKLREFTLMDMDDGSEGAPAAMESVTLGQIIHNNRDRLIVQLITVTAVVLAIVMGLSVFFKVETITVTGADTYSAWAVREASGISEGDKLLTFSKIRAASQIMANLPYVKGVRIGIKLPDTVNIMIEEESVVYAIKSSDGQWWMMDSDGRVVEQANNAKAATATQVLGVTLEAPTVNEKGVATEMAPSETNELGELIPVSTTGAQRLTAALQILKALENNDIVGEAASVDVTSTEDIILWYGTRYQVNLGDTSRLDYKVDCMNDAILQMSDYQSGVLDISFTIWPNQVGYTPFA